VAWAQERRAPTPAEAAKSLLDEAGAAPVEILADIALGPKLLPLLSKTEKAAVLEMVFRRAGEAHELWPLRNAVPVRKTAGPLADAGAGPLADREAGAALKLDALSIRCRIVQMLLDIDPKLARRLFEEIARPDPPKTDCAGSLVPDAGIYLETLAAIAKRADFSDEERRKGAPWLLVESGMGGLAGAWDVVNAARSFGSLITSESRAQVFSSRLASAMAYTDSDRAFTSAARQGVLITQALQAAAAVQRARTSDAPILMALRTY
jgi:hypothetical protein